MLCARVFFFSHLTESNYYISLETVSGSMFKYPLVSKNNGAHTNKQDSLPGPEGQAEDVSGGEQGQRYRGVQPSLL